MTGDTAGPSRLLCKYLNCSNPSCPFRHEDAEGNSIPPPALSAAKIAKEAKAKKIESVKVEVGPSSDNEDGDVEVVVSSKSLMDGALDDSKADKACRYGDRCTRRELLANRQLVNLIEIPADCKFTHPPSRPVPKAQRSFGIRPSSSPYKRPTNGNVSMVGMNVSRKFGAAAEKKLDPGAGEFKPAEAENGVEVA